MKKKMEENAHISLSSPTLRKQLPLIFWCISFLFPNALKSIKVVLKNK